MYTLEEGVLELGQNLEPLRHANARAIVRQNGVILGGALQIRSAGFRR